jgi:SAM-dependent methyltransferase
MNELFFKIFESLPQQGPGDDGSTASAFALLHNLPANPKILDIGCGSGRQTIALAGICPGCLITAVDLHGPFIDLLKNKAHMAGYDGRITCLVNDMAALDFSPESFDIIWSEGAAYSIGFLNAVSAWHSFLKPGGYMALSELSWKNKYAPKEIKDFFSKEYPDIKYFEDIKAQLSLACPGLSVQDSFFIPDLSWWEGYYNPLSEKVCEYRARYPKNEEVQGMLDSFELEIDMHARYADYYGYIFYILRKQS